MTDEPTVPAIATLIRLAFPELEHRAFAIMETELSKENMPTLPLAFVALMGITSENQSNDVRTPIDVLEHICIEFWMKPKTYKMTDGGVSPFYAYQDYSILMNQLLTALSDYLTPQGKYVRFISMATQSDEFALCVTFKVSVKWRWCSDKEMPHGIVRFTFNLNPDVPRERGGKDYIPPNACGQGTSLPPVDGDTPLPRE